jgi:hypothetical protein
MKLKQWDTFYNTNGYLCLVHKVQFGRAQIVNYNGTFYSIGLNVGISTKYSGSTLDADEFFTAFPKNLFNKHYDAENLLRYNNIKKRYYKKEDSGVKSKLLLLC